MNIAVVDAGGNLVAHGRMDNARIGAIDIAINKAWSARAFDMETAELGRYSQPGGPFFGIHASNGGRVMLLAGGVPLRRADRIIGALGVSGGAGEDDSRGAPGGVDALMSEGLWVRFFVKLDGSEGRLARPDFFLLGRIGGRSPCPSPRGAPGWY